MTLLSYLLAILKNVIYGSSVFFTADLTSSVDVLDLLALRFLISFFVLWLLKVSRLSNIKVGVLELFSVGARRSAMRSLLLTALFEPILYMLFETLGISMSTGVTTGVILSLAPAFACLFESVILKERSPLSKILFLGCGMVGAVLIALMSGTKSGKNSFLGILFLFLTVISGALFTVFSRKSSKHFLPLEISYAASMLGALVFNAINLVRHLLAGSILTYFAPLLVPENLIGFFFLSVVSTVLATSMNNLALAHIRSSTMSAFTGLSTLVTVLIGVFGYHESLEYYHYIGFSLILFGMVGVAYLSLKKEE